MWVVLDNATYHKNSSIKEFFHKSNINVLYTPAYSPTMNMSEYAFCNLKQAIRSKAFTTKLAYIYNYYNRNELVTAVKEEVANYDKRRVFSHAKHYLKNLIKEINRVISTYETIIQEANLSKTEIHIK